MGLGATTLGSVDMEQFHHPRKFFQTALSKQGKMMAEPGGGRGGRRERG